MKQDEGVVSGRTGGTAVICFCVVVADSKVREASGRQRPDQRGPQHLRPVHHEGTPVSISREYSCTLSRFERLLSARIIT